MLRPEAGETNQRLILRAVGHRDRAGDRHRALLLARGRRHRPGDRPDHRHRRRLRHADRPVRDLHRRRSPPTRCCSPTPWASPRWRQPASAPTATAIGIAIAAAAFLLWSNPGRGEEERSRRPLPRRKLPPGRFLGQPAKSPRARGATTGADFEQPHVRDRGRDDQVREARHQGGRLPRLGQGGGGEGARRRRHSLRRTSSRPSPATATATRPTASGRSTSSASPGSRSSTSTTTARPAPRRCSSPARRSRAAWSSARWRSASRRWSRARSASSTPTAPTRSTSTRCGCSRSATPSSRRRRRRCSATPAATTWRSTAPTPTTTPGSAGRTTSTRSTTPTPSSRTSTRLEDIKAAKMIHDPLTKLQCSPTSDGSACAIVASERYVEEHDLGGQAIEIAGQSMVTDLSSTFAEDTDCMKIVGSDMSKQAADEAYAEAGIAAERGRRLRAARLLQRQRAHHLRSARLRGRGRGPQAGRGRSDHLRRQGRRQPLRRADLQGPPAGRDRAGAVLGADLAAARGSRQATGRGRQDRPAAQHRPRRRRRGHRLQAGGLGGRRRRRARWRSSDSSLSGKVVAITGGARGIGKATATALVRKGCRVAIGDLDLALAEQTAAELGGGTVAARARRHRPRLLRRLPRRGRAPARPARRGRQQRRDHAGDAVRRGVAPTRSGASSTSTSTA